MPYSTKQSKALSRKRRARANIAGTSKCPRVSVHASLSSISVQLIDDESGKTLLSARDSGSKGTKTERASAVGVEIAKKAIEAGIKSIVFDRGSKKYHGRIAALADSMRKQGLIF